ncbi:MAG TPA: CBS domain-containing protein [Selenomonadales bacterium]|nr:CBS domain-containing protein [Selenomonadales bacterium]
MKAKDIMVQNVITVHRNATIKDIAKVLIDHGISGVPVVDDADALVGIVSEGDLLHKEANPRLPDYVNILGAVIYYNGVEHYREDFKKLMAGQAADIMTKKVVSVSEETDIMDIAQLMLERGIKRVPVVKDGKIIGIISRADIVKLLVN